ncbi:MAG TPA: PIN domain-containing protein [Candidatus Binatia bacterium]|nr:PIN domain-containing protein [Candidatus Binatia bacterium]
MIVLDANILIRATLGRRVRQILEDYSSRGSRFFAPDVAFEDAERHLPRLLEKRGRSSFDLRASLDYLRTMVEIVDRELYSLFEQEARERMRGRDEDDWPVLASALALGCAIWTEDEDFFRTGVAVWTTSRVELFLKSPYQGD